ncbi:hypothetical protein L1A70_21350 [Acinetobacter bereziniae]|uniref:hypothetical protein n=1 Tax=Acinetobacter bereziniae TaxID=106648 RepID=UPI00376FAA28
MTAAHTTVLELLGKQVSFIDKRIVELTDNSLITIETRYSGTVTEIVLSLTGNPQIALDDGDFFSLPELIDFKFL